MIRNVCVFCSSSDRLEEVYYRQARELGEAITREGWGLVYGGSSCGLMRELAVAVTAQGGAVTGIVTRRIAARGKADHTIANLLVAEDMKERKSLLRDRADGFIALPGGWGTLEEITEVITLKQLGEHCKPIVFLNSDGCYDTFLRFIRELTDKGFIAPVYAGLYRVADTVSQAVQMLKETPSLTEEKYL